MFKKLQIVLLCLICIFANSSYLHAQEGLTNDQKYHVVNVNEDGNYEVIKDFDSYAEAKVSHTLLKNSYHNLGISYGTSFLSIEQGVVAFEKAQDCSVTIEYENEAGDNGYTNGCYGVDAAFLENNTGSGKVKFMLSGVIGWADAQDVSIYPIETVPSNSSYVVADGYLYHQIQSNITATAYDNSIKLGKAPSYLKADQTYYSYDGHYFYESYQTMIQDYRQDIRKQAVNAANPFYSYFQYISHRTSSAYDEEALSKYFTDTLAINASLSSFYDKDNYIHDILTQSLLPSELPAFLQDQNLYGANALLMLSLSMNETASGKSVLAYTRNNLFGHAAFDSAVEENASRYQSLDASVYSHAVHYISNSYLNPDQFQYHGGFLGDKSGGMNVQYASDPYWGEKAAQYAQEIDEALGHKDENRYTLGISNNKEVKVYEKASDTSTTLYTVEKGMTFSFVLLEKTENKEGSWYLIQTDPSYDAQKKRVSDGTYSFTDSYGYIKADLIDTILNENQLDVKNYIPITFDANGGAFYPEASTLTLQVENGILPSVTTPTKDHALFTGWDKKLAAAKEKTTYTAQYKEVKELTLSEKPLTTYAVGDLLDVSNGECTISFADGSSEKLALTSEMVSGFDSSKEGSQTLTITYAGSSVSYEINISKEKQEKNSQLSSTANELIKNYAGKSDLSKDALLQLKQFQNDCSDMDVNTFSPTQIRQLDSIFQENLSPAYSVIIKNNTYDLSVSGMSLALQNQSSFLNHLFPKTIELKLKDNISSTKQALANKVAIANHMRLDASFSISGKSDMSGVQPDTEMIFSIKKPADHEYRQYKIYYIDGEDVYAIPTSQTQNRIIFISEKIGDYVIVSSTNTSLSEGEDIQENNTIATNGTNYISRYILLPVAFLLIMIILVISAKIIMKKKGIRLKHFSRKKK